MKIKKVKGKSDSPFTFWSVKILERETRFELATSTLARSRSTTELLPLANDYSTNCKNFVKSEESLRIERDVFNKSPIAARTDFDVADAFIRNDHICRIPQREHRNLLADNILRFEV